MYDKIHYKNKNKKKIKQKKKKENKVRVKVKSLSHVRIFATQWTAACQVPLSMGFSRQEHWSGLPFPSPEDLPNPGIEPGSPALQADALTSEPPYLYYLPNSGKCFSHLRLDTM